MTIQPITNIHVAKTPRASVPDHVAILDDEQHDGDHLEHCFELAVPASGDITVTLAGRNHAHAGDDELAGDDDQGNPAWQRTELDKRQAELP